MIHRETRLPRRCIVTWQLETNWDHPAMVWRHLTGKRRGISWTGSRGHHRRISYQSVWFDIFWMWREKQKLLHWIRFSRLFSNVQEPLFSDLLITVSENCYFSWKFSIFFFLTRDGRSLKAVKGNAPSFGNVLFLHIYIKMRISGPLNTFSNSS